ncbi:hypothetical protein SAMN04487917_101189 [Arthrobacter sp. yr096]|uniref:hypothetical protein n=1 Tax=Arthrobacter sp. yr096 TaxID=1761750 RepID=UPI0008D4A33B|nr:hypothetical protein [Arthrobacter sp. yr096]SEI42145.1 hypothetical protein SAMN04487917_101189 [Arthrobacter sp. yr096]
MGKLAEDRGNGVRQQVIDATANQVTWYSGVASFIEADSIPQGILSISEAGLPIDLLNSDVGSDTTMVVFHGAVESTSQLPVLSGQGLSTGIGVNRIFISDPSLYISEGLQLGWFAGNKAQPGLQSDLEKIIRRIVTSHGSRRVMFFGGSGGGFASLYFAARFAGSAAVVFNPQTNIARYQPSTVLDYAQIAYDAPDDVQEPLSYLPQLAVTDLCGLYAQPLGGAVVYLQNLNDLFHTENHMQPFLEAVHPDNPVFLLEDFWGPGHAPPPKPLLTEVLAGVAAVASWPMDIAEVVQYVKSPSFKAGIS